MTTQEQTFRALIAADMGRPFPAKFAGVCALTGIRFNAFEQIRRVGSSYCAQRTLSLALVFFEVPFEVQTERTAPFNFNKLQSWLEAGPVAVYGRSGTHKIYRAGQQSAAQLKARTRQAVWMVKA